MRRERVLRTGRNPVRCTPPRSGVGAEEFAGKGTSMEALAPRHLSPRSNGYEPVRDEHAGAFLNAVWIVPLGSAFLMSA